MVSSGTSGAEPRGSVAAGDDVLLDAESGDIETVDDVLRSQNHLDVTPYGHVQFVNLAMTFLVFEFPHPLFSYDIDLSGPARRRALLEKDDRAPHEDHHENSEWYDRPGNFQYRGAFNPFGGVAGTTTISGGKGQDHEEDGHAHECGQHYPKNVQSIYT